MLQSAAPRACLQDLTADIWLSLHSLYTAPALLRVDSFRVDLSYLSYTRHNRCEQTNHLLNDSVYAIRKKYIQSLLIISHSIIRSFRGFECFVAFPRPPLSPERNHTAATLLMMKHQIRQHEIPLTRSEAQR